MNADKRSTSMLLALVACATLVAAEARAGDAAGGEKQSKITRWTGSMPEGATTTASASAAAVAPAPMPVAASASAGMAAPAAAAKPMAAPKAMAMAAEKPAGDAVAAVPVKAKQGMDPRWVSEQNDASEMLRKEQLSRIEAKAAKAP